MAETLLINGEWRASSGGRTRDVMNPANGTVVQTVAHATVDDVRDAIQAADAAFPVWAGLPARERAAVMREGMRLFRANLDEAARTLTLEHGKPLNDSIKECTYSADVIEFYADEGRRIEGTHHAGDLGPTHSFVLKQPLGVVGAITPWNFPVDLLAWKIGPGLAAGCTFVIKPPCEAPLAATMFVKALVRQCHIRDLSANVVKTTE